MTSRYGADLESGALQDPGLAATRQEVVDWLDEREAKLLDVIGRTYDAQRLREHALEMAVAVDKQLRCYQTEDEFFSGVARIEAYLRDGVTEEKAIFASSDESMASTIDLERDAHFTITAQVAGAQQEGKR